MIRDVTTLMNDDTWRKFYGYLLMCITMNINEPEKELMKIACQRIAQGVRVLVILLDRKVQKMICAEQDEDFYNVLREYFPIDKLIIADQA